MEKHLIRRLQRTDTIRPKSAEANAGPWLDASEGWVLESSRHTRTPNLRDLGRLLEGVPCCTLHVEVSCATQWNRSSKSGDLCLPRGILRESQKASWRVPGDVASAASSRRSLQGRDVRTLQETADQSGVGREAAYGTVLRCKDTMDLGCSPMRREMHLSGTSMLFVHPRTSSPGVESICPQIVHQGRTFRKLLKISSRPMRRRLDGRHQQHHCLAWAAPDMQRRGEGSRRRRGHRLKFQALHPARVQVQVEDRVERQGENRS